MTVRPTLSGQDSRLGIHHTDRPPTPAAPARSAMAPAPAGPGTRRDAVLISARARELQKQDAVERGPGGEITSDRIREVLQRLVSGHYDRPEIRDLVLRRLGQDLR